MALEFEFLSPEDKPALIGISSPEIAGAAQLALAELGYKIHTAATHDEFSSRFTQVQYQVVMMEDTFGASSMDENFALKNLQVMPMAIRRHATILLVGEAFETMHPMQAYQQSVHAVINPVDLMNFRPVIQKAVADNDLFLHVYRDTQQRLARGPA